MRTVFLMISATALLAVTPLAQAASVPAFKSSSQAAPITDKEQRERDAATQYAVRREAAIGLARTTDDRGGARKALAAVIADPQFAALPPEAQRDVVSAAAWVEARSGRYEDAAAFYRRAVQLDPSDPDDWHRLSIAEDINGRHDEAADALLHILRQWPHLTDAISGGHMVELIRNLPADSERRLQLTQTLYDANWKREEEEASKLWLELALMRAQRGEREQAREAVARVAWPYPLMSAQADRRLDGLLPAEPAFVVESLRQLIDRLQVLSQDNPRNLYTHNAWLEALLHAGRNEEVLTVSDGILAKIAAQTEREPAYHDSDDENFTLLIRSRALSRLGRLDESEAALKRASRMTEYGEPNVGQKLSLAAWYNGRLRPDDAIALVRELAVMAEPPSLIRRDVVLMQAALLQGEQREAKQVLKRIREHADDDSDALMRALLRADHTSEAAAVFIGRLQDLRTRSEALWVAQPTLESEPLPGDTVFRKNLQAMLERPDVKAAIEAVGRVQTYPLW
ncbi:tetratricopeptide repeat protein [Lysobacter silvisoli]|uniref:Tetratricopeptide repeat protein n=1 Tax=Lysobacter silvisoli TaxID=2293254 RepID=A0A371K2K0_9GAMM|nr:tetratricopeptide repeat protein [Lysobacter silvisoli]RDZ28151.1 tetratricopeptide repeat protein [Lysobacter silvisoli]